MTMFLRVYAIYRKDKRILSLGIVVFIGMIGVASVSRSPPIITSLVFLNLVHVVGILKQRLLNRGTQSRMPYILSFVSNLSPFQYSLFIEFSRETGISQSIKGTTLQKLLTSIPRIRSGMDQHYSGRHLDFYAHRHQDVHCHWWAEI